MPPDEEIVDDEGNVVVDPDEGQSDDEPPATTATEELSEAEAKEAKNLYQLLKNPATQKDVLRVLAKSAGVMEDPPTTVTEVRETKKDLMKILEDKLGPDLKWLVPKLGGALEEILEQERDDSQKSFETIEREKVENQVLTISEKLNRESKGEFNKLQGRMDQLASEILPAPGQSVEKYMRHLFIIAQAERGNKVDKNKLADRIARNASNASERTRSVNDNTGGGTQPKPGEKVSLKQAVAQAAKALESKK
jgi:KaiC/GvpD/RAD55 family RecA-like ATPase